MKTTPRNQTTRWLILAIVSSLTLPLLAATYHVDAAKGADRHSGLNPAEPWKSLAKAASTTSFIT